MGAAGARLLYPDRRLQHCGLVVGLTGAAGHVLAGLPEEDPGYLHMAATTHECSAVTGACLATRRDVFELLEGFDEDLGVDLNDVDYCLRAAAKGLRTLYEPAAELIHHESPSRGTAGGVGDVVRFVDRWKDYIADGDRYLSPHLTRADRRADWRGRRRRTWNRWYATLTTGWAAMPNGTPHVPPAGRSRRRRRSDTSETTRPCSPSTVSGRCDARERRDRSVGQCAPGRGGYRADQIVACSSPWRARRTRLRLSVARVVERLTTLESVTADVTGTFGEEITQLRAEVLRLPSA